MKTILLGFFESFAARKIFFSFDRAGDLSAVCFETIARACKLFSLLLICGEEMRDCAEALSEVMKNLIGDSARKDSGEFLAVGRFLICDCPRIVEGKILSRPEAAIHGAVAAVNFADALESLKNMCNIKSLTKTD